MEFFTEFPELGRRSQMELRKGIDLAFRNFSREFRSSINEIAKETGVDDIKSKVENTNPKNFTDEMRDSINKNIIQSENQKKENE